MPRFNNTKIIIQEIVTITVGEEVLEEELEWEEKRGDK